MRKFLLILLNVLCLTVTNAQKRVLMYARNYTNDTTNTTFENQYFRNKNSCLDTVNRTVWINSNGTTIRHKYAKYHSNNWTNEVITVDSVFKKQISGNDTLNVYLQRDRYVYTAANVRADTVNIEYFNPVTKLWVYSHSFYFRKPGVGNDTFRSSKKMEVYNANAKLILDVYKTPNSSGDSIIHKYENNNKIRTETYVKSRLSWVDNYIYEGDNVKIYERLFHGIFNNIPYIDTTKRIYTYKNGLLDKEEYEEKKYSNNNLVSRLLTSHNKYLKQYEYDNINKTNGYKLTVCDYFLASKPCETTEIFTSVYSKDSLYRIDKRALYSLNNAHTTYYTEAFYANCTPTVSDVKEVLGNLDFTLAPNPTTGYFTLTLDNDPALMGVEINNTKVQIFNLQGQEVYNTKVNNSINSIDISQLNKGFYLVKVSDKTKTSVKKLVLN
jgi:hypothetical protein